MIKYKSSIITIVVILFIVAIITLVPKSGNVLAIEWLLWFCLTFLVYIAALLSDRLK